MTKTNTEEKKEETKALKPYEEIIGSTMNRINAMQKNNQLHFPDDYSPQNALQSAWLLLQGITDSNNKPVLEACTRASIANALLDMVIQGFNPVKKQCAFIAYGKQLCCQAEYFGNMLLAKRADTRIADNGIQAEVIYAGDEFEWEIIKGKRFITKHKQTFKGMQNGKIDGAYCTIISKDGEILNTVIMTMAEIHSAWKKSRTKPFDDKGNLKPNSTHAQYPVEMSKKTATNRACKPIINSSSDKNLLASVKRQDIIQAEETAQEEIDGNANQEFLDFDKEGEIVDAEFDVEQLEEEQTSNEEKPTGKPDNEGTPSSDDIEKADQEREQKVAGNGKGQERMKF